MSEWEAFYCRKFFFKLVLGLYLKNGQDFGVLLE